VHLGQASIEESPLKSVAKLASLLLHDYPVLNAPGNREHFDREMFHGFDFDATMLRIGSMNLMLHGIESPKIEARDSLSEDHAGVEEALP
jgi:type I restriction-modification system DNA methylase subunit